ncbi:MAG: 7TMR-DISM family protein, partial [Thermoanaerobaculaceae bacterium]
MSRSEEGPCQLFGDVEVVTGRKAGFPPSRLAEDPSRVTWRPNQDKEPAPGTYWLRFSLTNPGSANAFCVLIPPKLAPLVELYPWGGDEPLARSGWLLPLSQRAMSRPSPAIPVSVPPGLTTWLLKVTVPEGAYATPRNLRVEARTHASFYAQDLRANHLHGIYGGIMLAVVLYHLFLFFSLRERLYLLYALHATSFSVIWLVRAGMALAFLWPWWPRWDASANFYFIGLAIVAANTFTSEFLALRRQLPGGYHTLRVLSLASLLCLLGGTWQMYPYVETPLALVALLTSEESRQARERAEAAHRELK